MSTSAAMPSRSFVQTPIFSVSPSSYSNRHHHHMLERVQLQLQTQLHPLEMASRSEFSPARCSATVLSWVSQLAAPGQCLPVASCTPETSDLVRTRNWPLDEGKSNRVGGLRPNEETMSLSTPSSHPLCQFSPNPPTPSNNRIPRQCRRDVAVQTPMFSVSPSSCSLSPI